MIVSKCEKIWCGSEMIDDADDAYGSGTNTQPWKTHSGSIMVMVTTLQTTNHHGQIPSILKHGHE